MLSHTEWKTEAHMISYLVWLPVKKILLYSMNVFNNAACVE